MRIRLMPSVVTVMLALCTGARGADPVTQQPSGLKKRTAPLDKARSADLKNRERTKAMLRLLDSSIEAVQFDATPLEEVFDWFKTQGLNNLIVSWKVLENTGEITRDTPITLELQDLPLGELLDHVLAQASDATRLEEDQLTYHIFDGIVYVSSRGDFDRQIYTRAYYVEDLLQPILRNQLLPYLQIGQQTAYVAELDPQVAGGAVAQRPIIDVIDTGSRHGPGDPGYGKPDFKAMREAELEKLIALLKTVRPQTWTGSGGKGTLSAFGEKLVINQTIEMHEIIGGAFEKVRTGPPERRAKP